MERNGKFSALSGLNGKDKPARMGKAPGRPMTGKRSDTDYSSVSFFLKRETYIKTKLILINRKYDAKYDKMDFSELMQSLLEKWVSEQRV